jgi:hypothetical protein
MGIRSNDRAQDPRISLHSMYIVNWCTMREEGFQSDCGVNSSLQRRKRTADDAHTPYTHPPILFPFTGTMYLELIRVNQFGHRLEERDFAWIWRGKKRVAPMSFLLVIHTTNTLIYYLVVLPTPSLLTP